MTHDPQQVLVGGDRETWAWLKTRFGIDVNQTYIAEDGVIIHLGKKDEITTMTVRFLLGADDLAAFPLRPPAEYKHGKPQ